jgi:hypothetical protein
MVQCETVEEGFDTPRTDERTRDNEHYLMDDTQREYVNYLANTKHTYYEHEQLI